MAYRTNRATGGDTNLGRRVALYPLMIQGNPLYTALKFLSNYGLDYLNSEHVSGNATREKSFVRVASTKGTAKAKRRVAMDTALSSQSRPAAVLSSFSFVITLLFIVFKGNRREGRK